MKLKSAETSIWACLNASTEPRMPTSAVSFCNDEVVQERRDHAAHGLREHDRGERLAAREAERPRRGLLARVHRLDPGAVDLGDVGRVDEHERDDPPERRRRRDAFDRERRRAEAEQGDHENRRDAAEEVGVGDRERADREEDRAWRLRSTASASAVTRMIASAMQKIFTFSRNAARSPGTNAGRRPSRRRPP